MTYNAWSSDFALYLEDYLMYELCDLGQYDPTFDLKINVGLSDFVLYLQDYLMHECHIFR